MPQTVCRPNTRQSTHTTTENESRCETQHLTWITYHFRSNQHTTRNIQIKAIDHTDIQTEKRNAERDLQTKETHWINTLSTIIPLSLNYISTDTIIRTKWRNQEIQTQRRPQHKPTQPTPDPTCTNTTPKNQPYPSDQRDTNNTYRTKSILQITNPPTNLSRL